MTRRPNPTAAVDPRFSAELRRLRTARGLSLRTLASEVYQGKSHIHMLETGDAHPTVDLAGRLDEALQAGGTLAAMVADARPGLTLADESRLAYAVQFPSRADHGTVDGLEILLAGQRRLEDSIGAAAVIDPVRAQLALIVDLVAESRDAVRPRLVQAAAEWAQFGGWLHQAAGDPVGADRWLSRALEWATEVGNRDLIGTLLSFRAFLAEDLGQLGNMIGLTRATLLDPAVHISQRAYDQYQLGRGLARVGEASEARSAIAAGDDLAVAADEDTGDVPPWHYYRSPAFFSVEAGRALTAIGDRAAAEQAIERLTTGLTGLPTGTQGADWGGSYLCDLIGAQAQTGNLASARDAAVRARRIGTATRSSRLLRKVDTTVHRYQLSMDS